MPRVRADNDARYALRASFVDKNGDVITGDTITIGGSVQDGDTVGQVTTWSGSAWTPDSSLTIDASGNASFSGQLQVTGSLGNAAFADNGCDLRFSRSDANYVTATDANGFLIFRTGGQNERLRIDATGDASMSGNLSLLNGGKQYIGGFGAKSTAGVTDWNDASNARSGNGATLLFGTHSNGPGPPVYFHPFSFEYASKDGSGNLAQLAVPYRPGHDDDSSSIWMRSRYSGTWSGWTEVGGGGGGVLELGSGGGDYGSVNTPDTNPATGGWHGYSIGGRAVFMNNVSGSGTTGIYNDQNNHWLFLGTHNGASSMYHAGAQTIYTYASGGRVTGNLLASSDVYAYYSDERLKDVVGRIEKPLESIGAIDTFYYTHNDKARELGYEGSERQVGVSAQSVQAVLPEVIGRAPIDDDGEGGSVTGEDYITVQYHRIVPLLIEGIKELTEELKCVKLELEEMKRG